MGISCRGEYLQAFQRLFFDFLGKGVLRIFDSLPPRFLSLVCNTLFKKTLFYRVFPLEINKKVLGFYDLQTGFEGEKGGSAGINCSWEYLQAFQRLFLVFWGKGY